MRVLSNTSLVLGKETIVSWRVQTLGSLGSKCYDPKLMGHLVFPGQGLDEKA